MRETLGGALRRRRRRDAAKVETELLRLAAKPFNKPLLGALRH
jgi:hypothetical protein